MVLGAPGYRKEAVRSNLWKIQSRTGRNFSRARVSTEVKYLPPNSLYMHRRFQNRKNQVGWIYISRDIIRNVECISVAAHIEMF